MRNANRGATGGGLGARRRRGNAPNLRLLAKDARNLMCDKASVNNCCSYYMNALFVGSMGINAKEASGVCGSRFGTGK